MYELKIQGNDIKNISGSRIGIINGNDIKDKSGKRIGFVQGKDIKDLSGHRIAYLIGNDIKDITGKSIMKLDQIPKIIDSPFHGITLAAVWIFFLK